MDAAVGYLKQLLKLPLLRAKKKYLAQFVPSGTFMQHLAVLQRTRLTERSTRTLLHIVPNSHCTSFAKWKYRVDRGRCNIHASAALAFLPVFLKIGPSGTSDSTIAFFRPKALTIHKSTSSRRLSLARHKNLIRCVKENFTTCIFFRCGFGMMNKGLRISPLDTCALKHV